MLDTERLYLREQTEEDLDRLYEIYSSENITRYMEGLYDNREEELEFTRAYIKNMYQFYGYGVWIVCLKENDEIIGRAGLSNRMVDGINELELGYVIGEEYQGKGYAVEVCSAICRFAKEWLCAGKLVCFMRKENIPSIRLAKKLGFDYVTEVAVEEGDIFAYYEKVL